MASRIKSLAGSVTLSHRLLFSGPTSAWPALVSLVAFQQVSWWITLLGLPAVAGQDSSATQRRNGFLEPCPLSRLAIANPQVTSFCWVGYKIPCHSVFPNPGVPNLLLFLISPFRALLYSCLSLISSRIYGSN